MSGPHHDLQLLLGAYVLGGLSATDRHRLEEHLPACPECTAELSQFAVVPGLLQLAAVSGVDPDLPAPPEDSLRRLINVARTRRRRARQRVLLAAAATVLVLAGAASSAWWFTRPGPSPASTPLVAASAPSATPAQSPSGEVILEAKSWGTQIKLTMYYAGAGDGAMTAWAVSTDGRQEQAATWQTPPDGRCYVIGATAIKRDQLLRVEVRAPDGTTVLKAYG
jgi:hypothetical protein